MNVREPVTDVIPLVPAQRRSVEEFQVITVAEASGMQMWRRDPVRERAVRETTRPERAVRDTGCPERAARATGVGAAEPWPTALGGRRRPKARWWRRG